MEIGDIIYWATFDNTHRKVTCPDCLGKLRLTVIMGDGEHLSIECVTCAAGYDPPTGLVSAWEYEPKVRTGVISGKRENEAGVEYEVRESGHCWSVGTEDAFDNETDAAARAAEKALAYSEKQRQGFSEKEKPRRTWAWNAAYHRRQMKDAKRHLEYHSQKLNIALEKKG